MFIVSMNVEMIFFVKMSLLGENQTEPEAVDVEVGRDDETARRTAEPRTAVPTTTTVHTERPTIGTCRIRQIETRIRTIPILTPFPYVT